MSELLSFGFDGELRRETRATHWGLFIVGSLLMLPTGLVMYWAVAFSERIRLDAALIGAFAGAGCGVFAWLALGLLFFKSAEPRWHLVAWRLVLLFGIVAGSGCLYFLFRVVELVPVIAPILMASVFSVVISLQNLDLTHKSLEALQDQSNTGVR